MRKVSVIVTTYNSQSFIEETLNSILNQEGVGVDFTLQVIVCDDHSTDQTIDKVKALSSNIQLIKNPKNTGGPNTGRNKGLEAATGEVLCIADHDDLWHPKKLQVMLPFIAEAPILSCAYSVTDETVGKKWERGLSAGSGAPYTLYKKNDTFQKIMLRKASGQKVYLGTLLFRAELKQHRFEEHFGSIDYDWLLRMFHENCSIEVHQVLHNRQVDGKNLSLNEDYRLKNYYYSLYTNENYRERYPKLLKKSNAAINASMGKYYYSIENFSLARVYFKRASFSIKNMLYYLTTFFGGKWVNKKYSVFG